MNTEQTGWLIEQRGNTPCWWDGKGEWTNDSLKALRFARKEDAEIYIADVGWTEAFASEHIWSDLPAVRPAPGDGDHTSPMTAGSETFLPDPIAGLRDFTIAQMEEEIEWRRAHAPVEKEWDV